jgi:hypothetical protein
MYGLLPGREEPSALLTGALYGNFDHRLEQCAKSWKLEQRYIIKFFSDKGLFGIEIIRRLNEYYGEQNISLVIAWSLLGSKRSNSETKTSSTSRHQEWNMMKLFLPALPKHISQIFISHLQRLPTP